VVDPLVGVVGLVVVVDPLVGVVGLVVVVDPLAGEVGLVVLVDPLGVVGLVVLVDPLGVVGLVVLVDPLAGEVDLVPFPGVPIFFGAVVVATFGAPVAVEDGCVVVEVEVAAAPLCAFAASVGTGEDDPPTVNPRAIPPPTIASVRAAMPARATMPRRGLFARELLSVMPIEATAHHE
jgi:hypothetical protein